jgi:hypothetical protein
MNGRSSFALGQGENFDLFFIWLSDPQFACQIDIANIIRITVYRSRTEDGFGRGVNDIHLHFVSIGNEDNAASCISRCYAYIMSATKAILCAESSNGRDRQCFRIQPGRGFRYGLPGRGLDQVGRCSPGHQSQCHPNHRAEELVWVEDFQAQLSRCYKLLRSTTGVDLLR